MSVLSFVVLKVAEDQSKQSNGQVNVYQGNSSANGQVNGCVNVQLNEQVKKQVNAPAIGNGNQILSNRIENNNIPIKPAGKLPIFNDKVSSYVNVFIVFFSRWSSKTTPNSSQ